MAINVGRVLALVVLVGAAAHSAWAQPIAPVRVIAEWEPAVGTLISWPLGIPRDLVVELARDDQLFVLVTGPSAQSQAAATFAGWGIDPAHVEYIHTSVQTHWPRDWGPHQVFDGAGQWGIVDPIFEGYPWVDWPCVPITSPGGYSGDNAVNGDVASYFGAPLHALPAYLTGGNILVDGQQRAFSTCAMVGENQQFWTEAQFLALAEQYLGVDQYYILDNTEDHGIQHLDCWFKVLDEETLLVKQPPTWHEEYPRIEANLQLLAGAVNHYGRPYRIVRIDCPPYSGERIAAYCNSLILNRKVFVPLFDIPGDQAALQTFADALPGYEIHGFPWGNWYYYDALHCRTRAVFDRHMLRLTHGRSPDEVPFAATHMVTVVIDDRSEQGLIADQLRVHYRLAGSGAWNSVLLTPTGDLDEYAADLPGPSVGSTLEYYIAAADLSGRQESLPRSAPDGFYSFTVVDTGLSITVEAPPSWVSPWTLTSFVVEVDPGTDQLEPGSEQLVYRYDGGDYVSAPLTSLGGSLYEATLPRARCTDQPEFYVVAEAVEGGLRTAPPSAPTIVYSAAVGTPELATVWTEGLEAGLPTGWTGSGLWHTTSSCRVEPPCNGSRWAYFGLDGSCSYATGQREVGALSTASLSLPEPAAGGQVVLTYCSTLETENEAGYDVAGCYVGDTLVDAPAESAVWETRAVDLTDWAGQTVHVEWRFDTIDDYYNNYRGWQVDAVTLQATQLTCDDPGPCPHGDFDCDGVADLADFVPLSQCLAGPQTLPSPPHPVTPANCLDVFDHDDDDDVDLADLAAFATALTP